MAALAAMEGIMFREMRRKDKLVDKNTGIELLKSCNYGILSVLGDDDYPYGLPINYAYKDGFIYMHGFVDGHKLDAIAKHPKVCFTVVGDTEVLKKEVSTNFISVVAFGKAEVLLPPENEARQEAFVIIMDRFVPNEKERTTAYIKENEAEASVIKIKIEHMTCKESVKRP